MAGLATVFGSGAMTNSIDEIEGSEAIFVIGSNTTENHPVIGYRVRKAVRNGTRLIVADPRKIPLADISEIYLPLRPGTDVALLNGIVNVIIKEGLEDREFIAARTEGFEEMKRVVERYTPEYAEKLSGVPAEDIIAAARSFAAAKTGVILYTMGVTQHTSGTENVLALANLALVTGNLGRVSTGMNPLRGQNNVQGACDMGALPVVFTGYQPVANDDIRRKFADYWGVELSGKPGLTMTEMFKAAEAKEIRAMYVMGENPFLTEPDVNHAAECLEALDFLVVQDIFLTETARIADVVLPAASFAEKDGTFVNTERRVQRIRRAVKPRGEAKPDWEILQLLAGRLGFAWNYENPGEIMEEIAALTPSYGGISYSRLEAGSLQWPCPTADHPGTPFLHAGRFTRGLGRFTPVEYRPAAEETDGEYPYILTTGRSLYHYHTASMTGKTDGLVSFHGEEFVEINPSDAGKLGIGPGDAVRVSSRRGSVTARTKTTERITPGVVFMTFHFAAAPSNCLTNTACCDISKTPELKVCVVKIEKA